MTQEIQGLIGEPHDVLTLGEPTHAEPAFGWARNKILADLAPCGYRSIVLETDRVAALTVDRFVQEGIGTLDGVMAEGFSHGMGELEANRALVDWLRRYNADKPASQRVACCGFDPPIEIHCAPSPRGYLEQVRDYLGTDHDIARLAGEDERWSRTEAVLDARESVGDTPEAHRLRALADDLLTTLYSRAPALIAETSAVAWHHAAVHARAALDLLRYHAQAARRLEQTARFTLLTATRDALMARNLRDILAHQADRGRTLVFAHNRHLQPHDSEWNRDGTEPRWSGAGAIATALGTRCLTVCGSLGRSDSLGVAAPPSDTIEGALDRRVTGWGLTTPEGLGSHRPRTDTAREPRYFPLEAADLATSAVMLHVSDGSAAVKALRATAG